MRLTDLQIKKLSLPQGRSQKTFFDDGLKGFGVRLSIGGAKSFVMVYGKKRNRKTFGRYPDMSLADARVAARKMIGRVAGANQEQQTNSLPFISAREQFLEDAKMRNKASTYEAYRRVLLKYFNFPTKMGSVTRQNIMQVVDDLKGRPSESRHAFVAIRTMMNWAVMRGLIEHSPVPPLRYKVPSRSRILTDKELKLVWNRTIEVGYPYGTIVQLLIFTGQRRGEIAGLKRNWISVDAITFPVGFCKNKREHKIPLSSLTKETLATVTGDDDMLFPARGKSEQPFNGWSKAKHEFDQPLNIAHYTLHDLRRTYSSNLAKLGVPIHLTERLLNHVSGTISGVSAVYNRHNYWNEMQKAAQQHCDFLQSIIKLSHSS